jgi:hypothetical protein
MSESSISGPRLRQHLTAESRHELSPQSILDKRLGQPMLLTDRYAAAFADAEVFQYAHIAFLP